MSETAELLSLDPHALGITAQQHAAVAFLIVAALIAWRLWVGVSPNGRGPMLGLFASTFLLMVGSQWALGLKDLTGGLWGATGAYTACLLVTRGRPERMLEVWKVTRERPPSREVRRSVTLHQIAFCVLLVGGMGVYLWPFETGI